MAAASTHPMPMAADQKGDTFKRVTAAAAAAVPATASATQGRLRRLGETVAAVEAAGGTVFEHTRALTVEDGSGLVRTDRGVITGDTVTGKADEAQGVFDKLDAVGIDLPDVFRLLEDEGVEKFEKSWQELLDATQEQLDSNKPSAKK